MNKLKVILRFVLLFIYLVELENVSSAPIQTWIPSNVTFDQINKTHVHVLHKGKLVETIHLKENFEERTTQMPQLPLADSSTPSTDTPTDKKTTCCGDNSKKQNLELLKIEKLKKQWLRLNLCYFNPVTCFVGKKN